MEEMAYIDGQTYKIGVHDRVFVLRNDEWCLTKNVDASKVRLFTNKKPIGETK